MNRSKKSPIDRFFSHVEQTKDCWYWVGSKDRDGYGVLRVPKTRTRYFRAHRWSYEFHIGPIPKGYLIDHICRIPACVNPQHLRVVTPRENTILNSRSYQAHNASKTHCKRGHHLEGKNLWIHLRKDRPDCIERRCRRCAADWMANHRAELRRQQD